MKRILFFIFLILSLVERSAFSEPKNPENKSQDLNCLTANAKGLCTGCQEGFYLDNNRGV